MTQLTVTIEDPSKVSTIRKLLLMIEGVYVSKPKTEKEPNLKEALEDVAAGRVTHYATVDDFFKEMGY